MPEATELALGKNLFDTKGCYNCHKLGAKGRSVGPELTKIGKPGHRTPDWLYDHFKDPEAVSPGSKMPNYGFADKEARALTIYMLSLTDEKIGQYYLSKKIIPEISVGKAIFEEKGCLSCHRLYGRGGTIGPDITYVAERRSSAWLFHHFREPQEASPGSVMPQFGFSDEEAEALTKFLTRIGRRTLEGADAYRGRKSFDEKGCLRCHKLYGRGGAVGPDLTFVASRRDAKWIMDHFRDPQDISPGTEMPRFYFSEDEIKSLTAFLLSLTTQEVVGYLILPGEKSEAVKIGKYLFDEYDCLECHRLAGEGDKEGSDLTNIASYRSAEWLKKWLKNPEEMDPDTEMPDFELSDEDVESLVRFLSIQK
jgi:cbb3-type cytochrome oxidase cytochrome c subunit